MSYIALSDIKDEHLRKKFDADPSIIDETTDYINNLAKGLGVDPASIPIPAPYPVKMLAVSYACMIASMRLIGKPDSVYEAKYKAYKTEATAWTNQINAEGLIGGKPPSPKKVYSIPMARG